MRARSPQDEFGDDPRVTRPHPMEVQHHSGAYPAVHNAEAADTFHGAVLASSAANPPTVLKVRYFVLSMLLGVMLLASRNPRVRQETKVHALGARAWAVHTYEAYRAQNMARPAPVPEVVAAPVAPPVATDAQKDVTKDVTKDAPKDVSQDVTKDATKDVAKDAQKDAPAAAHAAHRSSATAHPSAPHARAVPTPMPTPVRAPRPTPLPAGPTPLP